MRRTATNVGFGLVLLGFSSASFAALPDPLRVGPVVGLGISGASVRTSDDVEGSMSAFGGLSFDLAVTKSLWLQTDLVYLPQAFEYGLGTAHTRQSIDVFKVPVLVKGRFAVGDGNSAVTVFVGPSFGWVANKDVERGSLSYANPEVSNFSLCVEAGVGSETEIDSHLWLFADVRYAHGVTDVYKFTDVARISTTQLLVGLRFGL